MIISPVLAVSTYFCSLDVLLLAAATRRRGFTSIPGSILPPKCRSADNNKRQFNHQHRHGAFHLFHPLFAVAMSGSGSPDYKALFLKAEEERKREAELRRQAEERNRPTTFPEFIRHCHDLLWRPLRAKTPSRSTTGKIPAPIGQRCPIRLLPWNDCEDKQREIYESVCRYLQPTEGDARQLFTSLIALEDHGRRFARRPISSEQDLETYE